MEENAGGKKIILLLMSVYVCAWWRPGGGEETQRWNHPIAHAKEGGCGMVSTIVNVMVSSSLGSLTAVSGLQSMQSISSAFST